MPEERLQKILARAGVASRRHAEALIQKGRVSVDGKRVTELGSKADPRRQRVELDGRRIEPEPLLYLLLHKPRQVMCTVSDPEGRATVLDLVKKAGARVVPVGRLDYHTSGVLLLTNDGDFSAALTHPSHKVEKIYVAKVRGPWDEAAAERWQQSIEIDGKSTKPASVRRLRTEGDKVWIEVTLHEGKNRQIHRIGDAAGNPVLRLARISFAGLTHDDLRPGQWRYLTKDELTAMKKAYGVPKKIYLPPAAPEAPARVRRARTSTQVPAREGRAKAAQTRAEAANEPRKKRPAVSSARSSQQKPQQKTQRGSTQQARPRYQPPRG